MPFFAEDLYQQLKSDSMPESVHLNIWPAADKKKIDKNLEEKMVKIRELVAKVLAERVALGIKIRQPLASLKIRNSNFEIRNDKELLEILKEEVNVKEITFDVKMEKEIELNTEMTDELKKEGIEREEIRSFKGARKDLGLSSGVMASVGGTSVVLPPESIEKIKKEIGAKVFVISEPPKDIDIKKEIKIDGKVYWIFIKK